jgi:hypothetical protein
LGFLYGIGLLAEHEFNSQFRFLFGIGLLAAWVQQPVLIFIWYRVVGSTSSTASFAFYLASGCWQHEFNSQF